MIPPLKNLPPLPTDETRIGYEEPRIGVNPWLILGILAILAFIVIFIVKWEKVDNA